VIELTDLVTILLLVVLEGILSADNALVLAVLVLPLPPSQQRKALRYGILGAIVLRSLACIFAAALIRIHWMQLLGGLYLLHLTYRHFRSSHHVSLDAPVRAGTILGLSVFWSTVVKVELTDLVFAIDSILMAVGMSKKLWVIITGGILGIIAIRLLTGQLLTVIKRYPALIGGAYIIIAWIGIKLVVEYLHVVHVLGFSIPKAISLTVVVLLFAGSYFYARTRPSFDPDMTAKAEGPVPAGDTEELLK
jgi:YkoY family integral membrane protein